MMFQKLRLSPTLGALLLAALTLSASQAVAQRNMLYRVEGGGNTVYLMGSIHLATPDAYPLSPVVEHAFADAERVVFEAHLDSLELRAPEMLARGRYENGRTLRDDLSAETYSLLSKALPGYGLSIEKVEGLEPWLIGLAVLPAIEYQKAGITAEHGIDGHFNRRAREAGKPIGSLESVDFQLGLFDGLPPSEQDAFLRYTLETIGGMQSFMARSVEVWKAGDEVRMDSLFHSSRSAYPVLSAKLGAERNRRWVPQIEAMLGGSDDVFVVIGAGHLVGRDSVVELLRQRGHRVEQL